jgi:hypothetical protein
LVHFLWRKSTARFFFRDLKGKSRRPPRVRALSSGCSLVCGSVKHTIWLAQEQFAFRLHTVTSVVHRFEECIAGHPYLIEVVAVSQDRWRAYIVRLPGVPAALMPFYGATPTEAASQLCDWLTRAYARAANSAGTV